MLDSSDWAKLTHDQERKINFHFHSHFADGKRDKRKEEKEMELRKDDELVKLAVTDDYFQTTSSSREEDGWGWDETNWNRVWSDKTKSKSISMEG